MKLPGSIVPGYGLAALACLLAFNSLAAQQSSSNQPNKGNPTANTSNQNGEVRVEKFHVRQDFGPQPASRRGEQPATATPPAQNTGTHTETLKVKQEFGPQTASRRGDRTTAIAPQGSNGNNSTGTAQSSTSSSTTAKPPQPTPKPPTNKTKQKPQ